MASHHSASQWRTWIAQCEQSDLTVARFCQSIGVSVNTYYRWRQRLQREALACESAGGRERDAAQKGNNELRPFYLRVWGLATFGIALTVLLKSLAMLTIGIEELELKPDARHT